MANTIINWLFSGSNVSNSDGSHTANFHGTNEVAGPGSISLGNYPTALHFSQGSSCQSQLSPGSVDATRFAVRIAFRVTKTVTTRGNLIESTALPFSISVRPGSNANNFNIAASVGNGAAGWSGANTFNRENLNINQWYTASLVYDIDTLALFVNDDVVAVSAYPEGGLNAGTGDKVHVGTWVDGQRWTFTGDIAAVQIWKDIPQALETKLDIERGSAEWHLTRKENEVKSQLNLGPKTADFYYDPATRSYIQPYAISVISYTERHGAAFVMYGSILNKWRSDENLRRSLGGLASDEISGRRTGSRKSVFAKGCIYWSPQSGAHPVLGRMNIDYDLLGEGASAIGLPIAEEESISGGKMQHFQRGKMYMRNGASNAFEIHGSILRKYEAAGGSTQLGFPTSHESDVKDGTRTVGKVSEFERCTIYWSSRTSAAILRGAIRDRYRGTPSNPGEGGPLGDLGFPTSDEGNIPDAGSARYNTFENGSILWFSGSITVCRPFQVALGRLDTREEDQGIFDFDGQNDLYCRVRVNVNGGRVFDRKYPEHTTHFPTANIRDLNINVPYTITPNDPNMTAQVVVQVWESDDGNLVGGGDDHLGTMTSELNMANAWGMRNNNGLFRASNFGPWVNYLDWSVKPRITARTPMDTWGVQNRRTATIDWREYGAAFHDVDPDFEIDFGILDDGLKALYYELVVKGLASGGNCFGMCLENIDAWKERSRLGRPLARFTNWNNVENDFNVKHTYQVGANAVWWFLGQFVSGNTHNPTNVFQRTWDSFNRGDNPIICIAQNYDFSGGPHCILPIAWNRNVTPWEITVFDPNFPNQRRILTVDPNNNSFRYDGGSRVYTGDAWSGGRFHYMPWSILNHAQRTPVWDAILLLLTGVVVIFGENTEIQSITDENGNNLDGTSATNLNELEGKLLNVQGMFGDGAVKGGFYVGQQKEKHRIFNPVVISSLLHSTQPIETIASPIGLGTVSSTLFTPLSTTSHHLAIPPSARQPVASDAPSNAILGTDLMRMIRNNGISHMRPSQPDDLDTIRCNLRGTNNGKLQSYHKQGMLGVDIQSEISTGENTQINYERMSGRENEIQIKTDRPRQFTAAVSQKLGAGKDHLKIAISGLPSDPGKTVAINAQPGMGVLDILTTHSPSNVQITVDGIVGGEKVESRFNTRLQGGKRLIIPQLNDLGQIKVGDIDQIFGNARDFQLIRRQ